jgi:signal transduction histidine kinase
MTLLDWFAGGPRRYMVLTHCMRHDWLWIGITVLLDLTVAAGYVVIALHWWRNERPLADSPAKAALRNMKNIFVFCGLCGYLFIPIKMFWPAWRLYDAFLAVLAFYTWRYALRTRELKVVYNELKRSAELERDLVVSREESRRKSFFLNAVSHDLKTPLNGLMLQAELAELQLSAQDPEALREALAQIKGCARTTADLLNGFLELGRLDWSDERVRADHFKIGQMLQEAVDQVRARAELKNLSLTKRVPNDIEVVCDRFKLDRIVLNLLDNAIKFTHSGGIEVRADVDGAGLEIRVIDTGEGIADEHRALIFDDFFQVKNRERDSRKGYGLGLPIARRLARQLGGDLVVESELGHGSRFVLSLPGAVRHDKRPHGAAGHERAGPAAAAPAGRG